MSLNHNIYEALLAYAAAAGLTKTALSVAIWNSGGAIDRIRDGRATLSSIDKARAFIEANPVRGFSLGGSVLAPDREASAPDAGAPSGPAGADAVDGAARVPDRDAQSLRA